MFLTFGLNACSVVTGPMNIKSHMRSIRIMKVSLYCSHRVSSFLRLTSGLIAYSVVTGPTDINSQNTGPPIPCSIMKVGLYCSLKISSFFLLKSGLNAYSVVTGHLTKYRTYLFMKYYEGQSDPSISPSHFWPECI